MRPPELVTLIVPFHGSIDLLAPLLRALDDQTLEDLPRVIVSDDASPDPVDAGVRELGLRRVRVEVVRSERNGGPGAARNRALSLVDTPWVAFLDGDEVPETNWFERLVADLERTDADVVEGVIRTEGEVTPFTHATEAGPPDRHVGGNVAFRTELLESVGGFDERYYDVERRLHFREDADVTFRLEKAGARYDFDPDLVVHHPPLEASFWTPVKLARRYYFDALLAREHPQEFAAMHSLRRVGPVSLRGARHHAASAFVLAVVLIVAGALLSHRGLRRSGAALLAVSWPANVVALCWKRRVRPADVLPVITAAALTPFSYVYHHWRGVVTFRHRPRV